VRRRARALAALLEDVCDPRELDIALGPDGFTYNRHNHHYRAAHALSWMVLDRDGPDEALTPGPARLRSFLIDMSTLFERVLQRLLRCALCATGVTVVAQRAAPIFWRPDLRATYTGVRPDLILQRHARRQARLPLDAKYKRYDGANVDAGDLTQ